MVANLLKMERETGIEPATSSLGSWRELMSKKDVSQLNSSRVQALMA